MVYYLRSFGFVWICVHFCLSVWHTSHAFVWYNCILLAQMEEIFVLATWFLPLALSILWPQLITWNFHIIPGNFVQIPGTVLVVTFFPYRLAYLYIALISRHFPNYSLFSPTLAPRCLPSPNFSCLYCYNVVIAFELERYVKCLLFWYFTFLFCFNCCARFAACVFV